MGRFADARIPSAKAIPDVKGSRQEGEIRNTRNYRLRVRARRERSPFVPVEGRTSCSRRPERGRAPYTDLLKHVPAVVANRVLIIRRVSTTPYEKKIRESKGRKLYVTPQRLGDTS